ncbi:amidase [Tellurirhabdus bombi]|uniref:amidase n=1 Tax=Tellurirhabdus bombi TaxID=2907205 RepID=UPI001EEE6E26|nr:amidase family protein [Tellurirhabdus bombi]
MNVPSTSSLTFQEYAQYDAVGLAELVKKGDVSAAELLETAIARAEAVNPQLNAIVQPLYEEGRKMVSQLPVSAPFRGVPFLVKDLELEWAGTPLRAGCRGYQNYVSTADSGLVQRMKAAGLVLFGKTNTPEFGLTPYTESKLYGPARNPWKLTHSPGGSSGGSAAAVAAGIVPAATASDGGGSIRIPAANCGLFGLKPSRGRTSLGPRFGELWQGAVSSHVVTRTVRDSAALLDALAGATPGDPYGIAAPERPFTEEINQEPGRLRIAFTTGHPFLSQKLDPECVKAVQETARLLESLGHDVEEIPLPYDAPALSELFFTMVLAETGATVRELGIYLGRPARRLDVELNTWALARLSEAYSAVDFAFQLRRWNELARRMGTLHETYDLLLTPVLSRPPIQIGELQNSSTEDRLLKIVDSLGVLRHLKGSKIVTELAEKTFSYIPYTPIANMTGQPSMSVPLHRTPEGLPVGLMFTASIGNEALLFRLASQLEQARPWPKLAPLAE